MAGRISVHNTFAVAFAVPVTGCFDGAVFYLDTQASLSDLPNRPRPKATPNDMSRYITPDTQFNLRYYAPGVIKHLSPR